MIYFLKLLSLIPIAIVLGTLASACFNPQDWRFYFVILFGSILNVILINLIYETLRKNNRDR